MQHKEKHKTLRKMCAWFQGVGQSVHCGLHRPSSSVKFDIQHAGAV